MTPFGIKRNLTNIAIESKPTFKNCLSDFTFTKTFFSFFSKIKQILQNNVVVFVQYKKDISLPFFLFFLLLFFVEFRMFSL